ncbi:DNA mismatch repair protein MSH6 [Acorus calamus]|uniref:DNA mismatch repair protein MSH6 n=1 Tax=Acorus calamus TaxID=4465 RepID=A0AAV9EVZ5_ACOCL|nr:DNA mismatch repair protein MSH6 [Acorus calamus]
MTRKLEQQLRDVGAKLEKPPASKDALVKLLKQAGNYLSELDQSPSPSITESMQSCLNAIAQPELLKHQDRDVKLLVATCICEITRITAPEAPYSDDILRDIFHLIVGTFSGLDDINGPSFGRRVVILETLARYKSCVVMLDLECNDLINQMFSTFLGVISDDHPDSVLTSMQTIMVLLLDESEDIQESLVIILLSALGRERSDVSKAARGLAMKVIERCAGKLEPYIKPLLISSISGDDTMSDAPFDYHEVIYDIYQCAPQILTGVIPYITGELLADQLDVRLKAVNILGDLFALPGHDISEAFQPLFSEFLKRLADRVVEVRVSMIEHVKKCLMSNPSRAEASNIVSALCDRLLDYDENVRKQVVAAVCDLIAHSLKSIPAETAMLVAERLRDKSLLVKKYTMERLAELYKLSCSSSSHDSVIASELGWIPGKILRCFYDKDFRSETVEVILCGSLFPPELSVKDRVKHWLSIFSGFDKVEAKALDQLLAQKQRLQQDMQKYLSLRTHQESDAPEVQKRMLGCFRAMSRLFNDPAKAEESFQMLNQLKDANIWKLLTTLLDSNTSFLQAWTCRDDLLKILGEKHPLHGFMGVLTMKCSYLLFNKECVKEILSEATSVKSAGSVKNITSCMNLLVVIASFSPSLLGGVEEDLVNLLKEDDNEMIREGIVHVLAKAGGAIREQLAMTSSSVELILERLCLEGSRKQAKYSVQALGAITKDDGLKSLSVLYKRLVDMLDRKTHLPAILQSLGCIAQIAMPVFETREGEIVKFITSKVLECSNNAEGDPKTSHGEINELCLLKIFSIKTLVKSYLPIKDAHLRPGIENLYKILKNMLCFGEISKDIISSHADKDQLKLASAKAVLRLSKYWDKKLPVDLFYLCLNTSQDIDPQLRKLFLSKVHQYIKEKVLDPKYACFFLFNITEPQAPEYKEAKQNLVEVVQMCHQLKARQITLQSDVNSLTSYPEYILVHFVHALAHHPSFPNLSECRDVRAYEPVYWRLHLFLSVVLLGDECLPSEANSKRNQDSIFPIVSIFHSIMHSEDIVVGTKTKNSHAICELGLLITKKLIQNQENYPEMPTSVSLPPLLYRTIEKEEGKDSMVNGEQKWLADGEFLVHFESLKFEKNESIDLGSGKDEMLKDSDGDDNEVPLGKIMKRLKSRGAKKKKATKKQNYGERAEKDVDILGMVREIDLDNIQSSNGVGKNNFNENSSHFAIGEISVENVKSTASRKRKKTRTGDSISMPVPKRKKPPMQEELLMEKTVVEATDSDLLASCLVTPKSFPTGTKRKAPFENLNNTKNVAEKSNSPEVNNNISDDNEKGSVVSSRKPKRRSIAGLGKCSSQKPVNSDVKMIGSRIKVWWPMDKEFYEGIVQSYDQGMKKHTILYDDGDVEVLQLDKERWELIDNNDKPKKKQKLERSSFSEGILPRQKNGQTSTAASGRSNYASKKSTSSRGGRRKTNSKQHVSRDDGGTPERDSDVETSDSKGSRASDSSDSQPHDIEGEVHSGHAEGEQVTSFEAGEGTEQQPTDPEDSSEEDKPDSPISAQEADSDSDDELLSVWRRRAGKAVKN